MSEIADTTTTSPCVATPKKETNSEAKKQFFDQEDKMQESSDEANTLASPFSPGEKTPSSSKETTPHTTPRRTSLSPTLLEEKSESARRTTPSPSVVTPKKETNSAAKKLFFDPEDEKQESTEEANTLASPFPPGEKTPNSSKETTPHATPRRTSLSPTLQEELFPLPKPSDPLPEELDWFFSNEVPEEVELGVSEPNRYLNYPETNGYVYGLDLQNADNREKAVPFLKRLHEFRLSLPLFLKSLSKLQWTVTDCETQLLIENLVSETVRATYNWTVGFLLEKKRFVKQREEKNFQQQYCYCPDVTSSEVQVSVYMDEKLSSTEQHSAVDLTTQTEQPSSLENFEGKGPELYHPHGNKRLASENDIVDISRSSTSASAEITQPCRDFAQNSQSYDVQVNQWVTKDKPKLKNPAPSLEQPPHARKDLKFTPHWKVLLKGIPAKKEMESSILDTLCELGITVYLCQVLPEASGFLLHVKMNCPKIYEVKHLLGHEVKFSPYRKKKLHERNKMMKGKKKQRQAPIQPESLTHTGHHEVEKASVNKKLELFDGILDFVKEVTVSEDSELLFTSAKSIFKKLCAF